MDLAPAAERLAAAHSDVFPDRAVTAVGQGRIIVYALRDFDEILRVLPREWESYPVEVRKSGKIIALRADPGTRTPI